MVLRTAKTGRNAGGKFYGCSRYPECKATVPFDPNATDPDYTETIKTERDTQSLINVFLPRTLFARPRYQYCQVSFFESVAFPEEVLETINYEETEEEILKACSQWRIDYPIGKPSFTDKQRQIISVVEKILTRGRITLPSPQIERKFKKMFKSSRIAAPLSLIEFLGMRRFGNIQKSPWLDSEEEDVFYQDILPNLLGNNYKQFVLPQVQFSSLIIADQNSDLKASQRVDFAIFHPKLREKILVEIDGEQHKAHYDLDKERVRTLEGNGYTLIRIPVSEIHQREGRQLYFLKSKLATIQKWNSGCFEFPNNENLKLVQSIKLVHQIQITLLKAIQSGNLNFGDDISWHIVADLDESDLFNNKELNAILREAVSDFVELLTRLAKLYSVDFTIKDLICELTTNYTTDNSACGICISFCDKILTDLPTFYVQNIYFPYHIASSSFSTPPISESFKKPAEKDLEYFLQYLFRKPFFREGQYDGITRLLEGKDTLLLLPTGAGKSLVYQLASLLLPGRTVVIDPIISLMEDQIDNLAMVGIDRSIAITSLMVNTQERNLAIKLFGQGEYIFAYIAPERFQTIEFRESLRSLTVDIPISLIVVDEAHCVSEWGHDFRTAYLNIGRTSRNYCESNGRIPPLIALTGTASRSVLKDIIRELQIWDFDAIITPKTFDRPELKFRVIFAKSQEKTARLRGYLGQALPNLFNTSISTFYQTRGKGTYSGLIFCPHVGGEYGVERVADDIKKDLNIPVAIYSGKEPKNWDADQYRHHKQQVTKEFKRNKIPLLVCTKAFGMGIDKPNIRYTIHFGIPPSIESFYQEAGRAGRDRQESYCCIIASNDDPKRTNKLLNPITKVEEIDEIVKNTAWEDNDDITRVLYFHTNAFRGISAEMQDIEAILLYLGDISRKGEKSLVFPDFQRNVVEKSLHRLLIIGVVSDYTINYSNEEFTIQLSGANKEEIIEHYGEYVASYLYSRKQTEIEKASKFLSSPSHNKFVLEMINLLLHFIYDVIERGRRRAFYEMLLACTESPSDTALRQRILRYLEATEYSEDLEQIINDEEVGLKKCRDVFSKVASPNEAAELRGQVSRYLESYPDHPVLLMLRALTEIFSRDRSIEVTRQNFIAAVSSALTNYGLSNDKVFDFAIWGASNIAPRDLKLAREIITELLKAYPNRDFARKIISELPIDLGDIPAWFLLAKVVEKCESLV
jgi:ATP-dependent DNA helicase RecQ